MSDERSREERVNDPGADWPTDPNDAEGNQEWAKQARGLADAVRKSESPMEALFLAAIFIECKSFGPPGSGAPWVVSVQERVRLDAGFYRLDVVIRGKAVTLDVEIDGRDFHSTPEQIANDEARTLDLEAAGWEVIRFTGSDVWRDPTGCARRTREALEDLAIKRKPAEPSPYAFVNDLEAKGDHEAVDRFLRERQASALAKIEARGRGQR